MEALNIAADWNYPAPISRTPIYVYALVLLFDYVLYSLLAAALIERTHSSRRSEEKSPTHTSFGMSNSDDNVDENGHSKVFFRHVISWGMWTLGVVGGICRVTVWAVSKSAEYIWGQQLHSYSSLSQEQRTYVDNIDANCLGSQETSRRGKDKDRGKDRYCRDRKKVQQSRSAYDVRSRTVPPAVLGSRSVGSLNIRVDLEMRQTYTEIGENSACDRQGHKKGEGERTREGKDEEEEKRMPSNSSKENKQEIAARKTCMRIVDLSKEYVTDRTNVVILHRVTAELRQGTVTCLLGKCDKDTSFLSVDLLSRPVPSRHPFALASLTTHSHFLFPSFPYSFTTLMYSSFRDARYLNI